MTAALLALLALQADPRIESVERLAGDVNRPLLWTPLKVTVSSASGYDGDLSALSGFGFRTAKKLQLAPGGRATVLLPSIDPQELQAGKYAHKMPRDFVRPDRIVLVDSSLPFASELVSTSRILYQKIAPEDLRATQPRGLLEQADLILTRETCPTKEDAEKAVAALGEPPAALEAVDRALWPTAPSGGWVPTKKTWALYFAVVYALAAFVALAVLARRSPKFGLAGAAGVAVLGIAGYAALFPRYQVWAVSDRVEELRPGGETRDFRVWFINAASDVETSLAFPLLVKPIFPTPGGTEEAFTLRIDERGCRVEGLKLGPARGACFGATESGPPRKVDSDKAPEALSGTVLVRGGRARFLGDLPAGAPIPASADGENPVHRNPGFDAWSRVAGRDALFGVRSGGGAPAHDLETPDLADERERSTYLILRLR